MPGRSCETLLHQENISQKVLEKSQECERQPYQHWPDRQIRQIQNHAAFRCHDPSLVQLPQPCQTVRNRPAVLLQSHKATTIQKCEEKNSLHTLIINYIILS